MPYRQPNSKQSYWLSKVDPPLECMRSVVGVGVLLSASAKTGKVRTTSVVELTMTEYHLMSEGDGGARKEGK